MVMIVDNGLMEPDATQFTEVTGDDKWLEWKDWSGGTMMELMEADATPTSPES